MHEQELEYISTFCTAINGFLEKKAQLIQGLHPEQYVQGEQTQEITGDITPLLTDNNKQQFVTKTHDKTKVNDLLENEALNNQNFNDTRVIFYMKVMIQMVISIKDIRFISRTFLNF